MDNLETINGYTIGYHNGRPIYLEGIPKTDKVTLFSSNKYVKSAIALAKISQIINFDSRFGGPIKDSEWDDESIKYTIIRLDNKIVIDSTDSVFKVLAFHTEEARDMFLKEYFSLIKDYYML